MAVCSWCEQDMTSASTCWVKAFHRAGAPCALPPYGSEIGFRTWARAGNRCGDCGVEAGGSHHPGCDIARCPLCRGQLMSCGCRFDEDGPDEDFDEDDFYDEDDFDVDEAAEDCDCAACSLLGTPDDNVERENEDERRSIPG